MTNQAITLETVKNQAGFKKSAPIVEGYLKAAKQFGQEVTIEQAIEATGLMDQWKKAYYGGLSGITLEEFRSSLSGQQLALLRKAMLQAEKSHCMLTFELNGASVRAAGAGRCYTPKAKA